MSALTVNSNSHCCAIHESYTDHSEDGSIDWIHVERTYWLLVSKVLWCHVLSLAPLQVSRLLCCQERA